MTEHLPAVVIGAGSAGLSASYCLKQRSIMHAVLERSQVAGTWRSRRWDSFTLVTPNWTVKLPGGAYAGSEPDGYMPRDSVVQYLEQYATSNGLPVRPATDVTRVRQLAGKGSWEVTTDGGTLRADNVVVATGAFPEPLILPASKDVSPRVRQVHTSDYRNPAALPPGAVLVVGTGQSGIQIAEELLDRGRRVFISVGRCPRVPRRYRGKDAVHWLAASGFLDVRVNELPSPAMRLACNPQATGRDGGHDVDIWRLARRGATLLGRWQRADGERVQFGGDLGAMLAESEERSRKFLDDFDAYIARTGTAAPPPDPSARDFALPRQEPRTELDLRTEGIGAIVWATGFRPAYPWIEGCAFDQDGFPITQRGVTASPGLYFVGLHLLHKRKSGILLGVGEDAEHVAAHIAARRSGALQSRGTLK